MQTVEDTSAGATAQMLQDMEVEKAADDFLEDQNKKNLDESSESSGSSLDDALGFTKEEKAAIRGDSGAEEGPKRVDAEDANELAAWAEGVEEEYKKRRWRRERRRGRGE